MKADVIAKITNRAQVKRPDRHDCLFCPQSSACYWSGGISRMRQRGAFDREGHLMKRYAFWLALACTSLGSFALPATALGASAEAKKFCSEQWDAEKKAQTVPRGMTREKYLRQCTANYTADAGEPAPPPASDQQQPGEAAVWPPLPPGSN
jgi:hypothetical protein